MFWQRFLLLGFLLKRCCYWICTSLGCNLLDNRDFISLLPVCININMWKRYSSILFIPFQKKIILFIKFKKKTDISVLCPWYVECLLLCAPLVTNKQWEGFGKLDSACCLQLWNIKFLLWSLSATKNDLVSYYLSLFLIFSLADNFSLLSMNFSYILHILLFFTGQCTLDFMSLFCMLCNFQSKLAGDFSRILVQLLDENTFKLN